MISNYTSPPTPIRNLNGIFFETNNRANLFDAFEKNICLNMNLSNVSTTKEFNLKETI